MAQRNNAIQKPMVEWITADNKDAQGVADPRRKMVLNFDLQEDMSSLMTDLEKWTTIKTLVDAEFVNAGGTL